ncbi:lysophospholipid acyltransferase family protein [Mycobacterium triplex]|uniref:Phospholipid/glycerol acyltransferase n=1 Tax=Mycobacterium triplex TaxID=47839 RepID=A0A024JTA2_9MYCO|nr:lysophospholipid acyltransferase family protein [Mycobacterium triplex]CDO86846.1 phospholipid/glycerol acyltransferase [Mycobacterium triplex]
MDWGQVDIVAGETRANVIPLHSNRGRVAARRRAEASRQHPSLLPDPHGHASAEQLAAVVSEIDDHRRVGGGASATEAPLNEFAQQVAAVAGFFRQRMTGDYTVDEFGFDPHFNNAIVRPLLRFFFKSWFRCEVSGIENLPSEGPALLVANHAGVLPFDGLMLSVAVHDEHPAQRDMRLLAADMVFDLPLVGETARKAGHTMACTTDAHRLLAAGELTAVFPEGYKGLGKRFEDRYRLQRFGRGGFVTAALRTKAPIIPCSIIGSEEIYPMLTDVKLLARLFGLPYFPVTPLFPLAGPAGLLPLPSKWRIAFGEPIYTNDYAASDAEDPMVTFELTDQVRETIQQTLYRLLAGRRNVFLG